jgi:hypothetical protein
MVYEWRDKELTLDGIDDLKSTVISLRGKHIRVTVEEEVSECCEKWRGHSIPCPSGGWLAPGWAKFCPECGRKL